MPPYLIGGVAPLLHTSCQNNRRTLFHPITFLSRYCEKRLTIHIQTIGSSFLRLKGRMDSFHPRNLFWIMLVSCFTRETFPHFFFPALRQDILSGMILPLPTGSVLMLDDFILLLLQHPHCDPYQSRIIRMINRNELVF